MFDCINIISIFRCPIVIIIHAIGGVELLRLTIWKSFSIIIGFYRKKTSNRANKLNHSILKSNLYSAFIMNFLCNPLNMQHRPAKNQPYRIDTIYSSYFSTRAKNGMSKLFPEWNNKPSSVKMLVNIFMQFSYSTPPYRQRTSISSHGWLTFEKINCVFNWHVFSNKSFHLLSSIVAEILAIFPVLRWWYFHQYFACTSFEPLHNLCSQMESLWRHSSELDSYCRWLQLQQCQQQHTNQVEKVENNLQISKITWKWIFCDWRCQRTQCYYHWWCRPFDPYFCDEKYR